MLEARKNNRVDFDSFLNLTRSSDEVVVMNQNSHRESLLERNNVKVLVDHYGLNSRRKISRDMEHVYNMLKEDGAYIGCVQTHKQRREARFINKIPVLRSIFNLIEFIWHRFSPKIKGLNKVYFFFTKGKNRRLTKTEILGRLVYNGFTIEQTRELHNGKFYFLARRDKAKVAYLNNQTPSYGPIYKMPRIGKNGKILHVYKFRTMHPYSEYLQDYVLNQNGYAETGKPADDFRLTSWGKVLRKYWLDELPQLINVVKGEMKLVGVRPVSHRYFEDIPEHIRTLRLKQKPGCIPPYVALNKKGSVADVLLAEEIYLRLSFRKGKRIDLQLMILAVKNILIKGKRSA